MAKVRDIKYLNRDFNSFRNALINYSKTYFPTTYTDFSEASPGMMFMEMASYVGDVLSFYQDNQIQETFTQYANQTNNLFDLAYMFGYKPKVTGVAETTIDFYQRVPSVGAAKTPDFNYALVVGENAQVKSNVSNVNFLTEDLIDFTVSSSFDPTEITVYAVDASNNPTEYLVNLVDLGDLVDQLYLGDLVGPEHPEDLVGPGVLPLYLKMLHIGYLYYFL
jgi:hypothetical protein